MSKRETQYGQIALPDEWKDTPTLSERRVRSSGTQAPEDSKGVPIQSALKDALSSIQSLVQGERKESPIYMYTKEDKEKSLDVPMWLGRGVTVQPPRAAITVSALNTGGQELSEVLNRQLKDIAIKLPGFQLVNPDEVDKGEYEIKFVGPDHHRLRQRCVHLPQKTPGQFAVFTLTATEETFGRFKKDLAAAVDQFRSEQQGIR